MSELRFTRDEDEALVELVRINSTIYDTSRKDYKDFVARDNIWTEIAETMGRPVEDCKKRWRSVRDTYNRQKKNTKKSAKVKPYTWPLAQKLSFLNNIEQDRGIKTKIIKLESKESDDEEEETTYAEVSDSLSNYNNDSMTSPVEEENPMLQISTVDSLSQISFRSQGQESLSSTFVPGSHMFDNGNPWEAVSTFNKKRKANEHYSTGCDKDAVDKISPFKSVQIKQEAEGDSMDVFFRSMVLTVKQFSPPLMAEAKMKICKIITDLELRQLSSQIPSALHAESTDCEDLSKSQMFQQMNTLKTTDDGEIGGLPIVREGDEESKTRMPHSLSSAVGSIIQPHSRGTENEDEFDVVGRRIAFQLRGMDERQRLISEKLVSDIMFQGRLGKLKENSVVCISPSSHQSS